MYHVVLQFFDEDEPFEETLISMADKRGMADFKGFGGTFSFIFEHHSDAELFREEAEELAKFAEKVNFYAETYPYRGKINV